MDDPTLPLLILHVIIPKYNAILALLSRYYTKSMKRLRYILI